MIFSFLFIGVSIVIVFRLINFIVARIKKTFRLKNYLNDIVSVVELVVWIAFVVWVAKFVYDSKNYYAIISIASILLIVIIPSFFLLKDFISGLFFKIQNNISQGIYLDIEGLRGVVRKAGYFRIKIEDKQGNISSIAYSKVRSKIVSFPGNNQNLEKSTIEFEISGTDNVNHQISELKKAVMNTPWVAVSQQPIIENTSMENGKLLVEVGVFVLDRSYTQNIKQAVLTSLKS